MCSDTAVADGPTLGAPRTRPPPIGADRNPPASTSCRRHRVTMWPRKLPRRAASGRRNGQQRAAAARLLDWAGDRGPLESVGFRSRAARPGRTPRSQGSERRCNSPKPPAGRPLAKMSKPAPRNRPSAPHRPPVPRDRRTNPASSPSPPIRPCPSHPSGARTSRSPGRR